MSDQHPSPSAPVSPARLGRARGFATAFVVGLMVAGVPLAYLLVQTSRHRDTISLELRAASLELSLARAAVLARTGDYATARDVASSFFTAARSEVDNQSDALDSAHTTALRNVLQERDPIITLLARSDPASAERLTQLYVSYRAAVSKR